MVHRIGDWACLLAVVMGATGGVAWGQVLEEEIKLSASDGASGDQFGWSVAVDGGLVVVGSWLDDDLGTNSGSVYVFDAGSGAQLSKLVADDGAQGDVFAVSIDIADGIIVVGARNNDDDGTDSGSAYIFDALSGVQVAKLLADDASVDDRFGRSVAVGGGVVAVGSPLDDDFGSNSGSVYLYDASSGVQMMKILPDDGEAGDRFGFSVEIDNGVLAVGAYHDNEHGQNSGSVYFFDLVSGSQLAKISPDDGAGEDVFGRSIAMSDGVIVVGAAGDDNGVDFGSAYLFDVSSGLQIAKLLPDDGAAGDSFGGSVSIGQGVVAVGALFSQVGTGGAYLFDAGTGVQTNKLAQSDGFFGDFFGSSVSVNNGLVVVGALGDDGVGAAFVFVVCPADFTNDGELNFFDIAAFLKAFAAQEPAADFTHDEMWNFFDVSDFLSAYAAGCP